MVTCDQVQYQLRMLFYCQRSLDLHMEIIMPPVHRRNNDLLNATVRAGLYWVFSFTLMQRNLPYGSFGKGANMSELWDTAMELVSASTPDDAWLLKCWPGICRDRDWTSDADTNRDARARFVASVPAQRPFSKKGPRMAPSKWMSLPHAIKYERPDSNAKLWALGFLAMKKGWVSHWDDLFLPRTPLSKQKEMSLLALLDKGDAAPGEKTAAGSSTDPPPADAAVAAIGAGKDKVKESRASAKGLASRAKSDLYAKSQNAMHAVARLLTHLDYRDLQEIVLAISGPIQQEHASCLREMKTREGCVNYYAKMADGAWRQPLHAAVDSLKDLSALTRCASLTLVFSEDMRDAKHVEDEVCMEDAFCEHAWKFLSWMLTERAGSCQSHSVLYPLCLAGLCGAAEHQKNTLSSFKLDWASYAAAKEVTLPTVVAACARHTLNARAMEQTARVARQGDWTPTSALLTRARRMFGGVGCEDLIEDTLGKVRDAEHRDASSKVLRMWKAWEVPKVQKQISRWGRSEVAVPLATPCVGNAADLDSFFDARPSDTLDFASVKKFGSQQTWETFTPESLVFLAAEQQLMNHIHESHHDSFNLMDDAWWAQLLPLHHVILRRTPGKATQIFYTILVAPCGVLAWPVHRVGAAPRRFAWTWLG